MSQIEFMVPRQKKLSLKVSFDSRSEDENEVVVVEKVTGTRLFNAINFADHSPQWESNINDTPTSQAVIFSAQHKTGGPNVHSTWEPSTLRICPSDDKSVRIEALNDPNAKTSVVIATITWL